MTPNKIMYNIYDLENLNEVFIKKLISKEFRGQKWVRVFLNDNHHGLQHGNQVRLSCLKLIQQFTATEKKQFIAEGNLINKEYPYESAIAVVQLAAIFHDCGRYNVRGRVVAEEQKKHHIISSKRAIKFCKIIHQKNIAPYIKDAIISHDYQNKKLTPDLVSPKTIIGKVVQASDQLGWFHPESIKRTIEFNKILKVPFFSNDLSIKERLDWKPGGQNKDIVTVMLNQLYGPIGSDRFGIYAARKKVKYYIKLLKNNIIKESKKRGYKDEVIYLIEVFENYKKL